MNIQTFYLDNPIVMKRAIDVFEPEGDPRKTALFYVHGGGWHSGARDQFHYHLEHFSKVGYWTASAGYRLVPHVQWRDQLQDVMEGYDCFLRLLEKRDARIERIVVLGSSAGAHLASLLALMSPEQLGDRLVRLTGAWRAPDACVSINGPGSMERWPDMNETIRDSIEKLVGRRYDDETAAEEFASTSPDLYVREGTPDFLFQIVEREKYFPHELVYRMSEKIVAHGSKSHVILYEGAEHGFFYSLTSPIQQKALANLERYLQSVDAGE